MAFTIFFMSCEQVPNSQTVHPNIPKSGFDKKSYIEAQIGFSFFLTSIEFGELTSLEATAKINSYADRHGLERISEEKVKNLIYKQTPREDLSPIDQINQLVTDGHLAVVSKDMLILLANNLEDSTNELDYSNILLNFNQEVVGNEVLTEEDKSDLLVISDIMAANSDFIDQIIQNNNERGPCGDCVKKHRKQIFGWGSLAILINIILCLRFVEPFAIAACIVIAIGITLWGETCYHCKNDCDFCFT